MSSNQTIVSPVSLHSLPRQQRMLTYGGVLLAMFMASLDQTVIGTAMPRIIADLGGFSHYTWVSSAYIIASAVIMPITGRLTDMYGRKWLYLIGMSVFLISSVACGMSQDMLQLIASRAVKGIGAGIMMATGFTVIGDLFSPAERGKYVGYGSAVFGISSVVGPTLGGYITDVLSWQWVFYINIPFCLCVAVLFILYFPGIRPQGTRHRIDIAGILSFTLTIVPLMLALTWGGVDYSWHSNQIRGLFALSAVMLTVFILIEKKSKEPILPLEMFKNHIVAVSLLVTMLSGFSMYGSILFIPLFYQGVLGATATVSGNFLSPMMLGVVLGSFISGQCLSRTGGHYKRQGIVGFAILIAGLALLSAMDVRTTFAAAVFNISITGIGLGVIMPLYTIAVQNSVPYRLLGVATSSTAFFRSLGGAFGLAILGSVMNIQFRSGFLNRVPETVKALIPMDRLMSLIHNPQVLVNPQKQAYLKQTIINMSPQGVKLFEQMMAALRQSLQVALAHVFFTGLIVVGVAFFVNLFLKEIPLRKHHKAE